MHDEKTTEAPNNGMRHHCGTCHCCGGTIPCGVTHTRRWRNGGECPGSMNGRLCGAIAESHERSRPRPGSCQN